MAPSIFVYLHADNYSRSVNGLKPTPVPNSCLQVQSSTITSAVLEGYPGQWWGDNWKESLRKPELFKWFPRWECTFPLPGIKSFNYIVLHLKYPELFFLDMQWWQWRYETLEQMNELLFVHRIIICRNHTKHRTSGNILQILLMEEILHHQGCIKPRKYWDIYHSTGAGFLPSTVTISFFFTDSTLHLNHVFPSEKYNFNFSPPKGPLHWRWGHITSASLHKRGWNCFPGCSSTHAAGQGRGLNMDVSWVASWKSPQVHAFSKSWRARDRCKQWLT